MNPREPDGDSNHAGIFWENPYVTPKKWTFVVLPCSVHLSIFSLFHQANNWTFVIIITITIILIILVF
jgi:hypothetical protein